MIKINGLTFDYNSGTSAPLIDIPSWELHSGHCVFLYGASGAGKSTFIHLLSGLLKPTSGHIAIDGVELNQLKTRQMNRFRADYMGLISQQFNLIPFLTVKENILLAHSFQTRDKTDMNERMKVMMGELALCESLLNQKALQLSIGQQQRVAIIRAMANQPKLLLADEPTSALDDQAKQQFIEVLMETVKKQDMTLLFISHDQSLKRHFPEVIEMEALNAA